MGRCHNINITTITIKYAMVEQLHKLVGEDISCNAKTSYSAFI